MEIFGTIFCGLGLFIIGVRFISQNLKQFTGRQFKRLMARATKTRFISSLIGFLSGAFSQSGSASVFITTSLHTAGLLSMNRSLTIINWANIGTSVLVFLVAIKIKLIVFYVLGLIGFFYYLQMDRKARVHITLQVFLGLGLLFMGIQYMKSGAHDLESLSWLKDLLHMSAGSMILLFTIGALLAFIIQSSSAVSVIAISLTAANLLTANQTIIIVLGTGIGSAVNILFLSWTYKGTSRQLSIYQAFFKISGAFLSSGILVMYNHLFKPLFPGIADIVIPVGHQVAVVYLSMEVLPTIVLSFLHRPVLRILERLSPPSKQELLSKPHYIYERALDEPVTALALIEKEQVRLMKFLPLYLEQVSPERSENPETNYQLLSEGFSKVSVEVDRYLSEMSSMPESLTCHGRILQVQGINYNLQSLETSVYEFVDTAHHSYSEIIHQHLAVNMIESLRAILETATDGFETNARQDVELTLSLTNDRGDLLSNIRKLHLSSEKEMEMKLRQSLFSMTLLFERIIWQIRSISQIKMQEFQDKQE